ncbi:MAG: acetyl-CoA carboxylase carboxyltransferase subunit alpha [Mycoplasmatales bacterium]
MNEHYQRIQLARANERVKGFEFLEAICDEFYELHGDRLYGDDQAIVGGIGRIGKHVVTIICQDKGISQEERLKKNYGMPHPEGYRKALRLMKQAEKFNRPIVTIVDTAGAYPGIGAEERGQGEAIATNLFEMSDLNVPIISILLSEGGSGGALGIAVCDHMMMFENAYYSVISPEGFASIIYKDGARAPEAVEKMKIQANDLLKLKIIDQIISENDELLTPLAVASRKAELQQLIIKQIDGLESISKSELKNRRYNRFSQFGN